MKQFNASASTFRIKVLLCCSAAVLLTACGGNIDGGTDQLLATAASVSTDAGAPAAAGGAAPAAAVDAIAEAAPAASTDAAPVARTEALPAASSADATAQVAEVRAGAFELSAYGSQPPQTHAAQPEPSIKQ